MPAIKQSVCFNPFTTYQCDRTAWGAALCRAVGSPRFKLLYDIYHMQIMEGDLIRTITEHIDCIGHFHTAGKTSTISKRSTIRRSCGPSPPLPTRATSATSTGPRATPLTR